MLGRWTRLACLAPVLAFTAGAGAGDLPLQDQSAARKLYVAKCAKCHKFYEPKNYSNEEWRKWMESMSRKSRLKPAQAELLNRYLDEYRRGVSPIILAPPLSARDGPPASQARAETRRGRSNTSLLTLLPP
ncbi:MAG TPA: hypothetical protein PKX23_14450 [Verrucomicrobiota bacterium]|nr:hypothetical protein [Verrucomicrobiota bacterium]HRT58429.1 hypothetical protein [Candidatus Paceibacterota bacterium]